MVGVSGPQPPGEAGNTPAAPAARAAPSQAADQACIADGRTILIVTGVSRSGKTTIATALAQRLDWPFEEGDDLHPASNITKMYSGHPLSDRNRWPWLEPAD
jgi:hypothetical protein